ALDERVRSRVQAILSGAGGFFNALDMASRAILNTVNAAIYVVVLSWADLAYYGGSFSGTALKFYATEIFNYDLPPSLAGFVDYFEKEDVAWGRYLQTNYFPYSGN